MAVRESASSTATTLYQPDKGGEQLAARPSALQLASYLQSSNAESGLPRHSSGFCLDSFARSFSIGNGFPSLPSLASFKLSVSQWDDHEPDGFDIGLDTIDLEGASPALDDLLPSPTEKTAPIDSSYHALPADSMAPSEPRRSSTARVRLCSKLGAATTATTATTTTTTAPPSSNRPQPPEGEAFSLGAYLRYLEGVERQRKPRFMTVQPRAKRARLQPVWFQNQPKLLEYEVR